MPDRPKNGMTLSFQPVALTVGTLTVARLGSGSPVILIPNYGRPATDFADLAVHLAEAGFEAIAINPRGSNLFTDTPQPTLHDLAADVAEVMRYLQINRAHLVGHAFGNRIARCLAVDQPELVRSLVLLAAGGKYPPDPEALETGRTFLQGEVPGAARLDDKRRAESVQSVWFTNRTDGRVWVEGWNPVQIIAFTAASNATCLEDWWDGGSAPMLVIHGINDRIAPPANGRDLSDRFPDRVSLVEIPDTAHALLPEEPERIASEIIQFLNTVEGKREND